MLIGAMISIWLLSITRICVGRGSLPPRLSNIFWKIGTMKIRTPLIISRLKQMTMTG